MAAALTKEELAYLLLKGHLKGIGISLEAISTELVFRAERAGLSPDRYAHLLDEITAEVAAEILQDQGIPAACRAARFLH